jgi:hypothetical protein
MKSHPNLAFKHVAYHFAVPNFTGIRALNLAGGVHDFQGVSEYSSLVRTSDALRARDLASIEELLRDLPDETGTTNGLMREHLEAARFYLLGCMPEEYNLTLKLAKDLVPSMIDQHLRHRIAGFLQSQELSRP